MRTKKPKPSLQQCRAAAVEKAIKKWTRKRKLAETKLKGLRQRQKHYQRAAEIKKRKLNPAEFLFAQQEAGHHD